MAEYTIRWQEPTKETIKHMQWWVRWLPWLFAPGLRDMEISFSAEKLDRMSVVIEEDEDSVCSIVEENESGISHYIVSRYDGTILKAEGVMVRDEKKVLFTLLGDRDRDIA